MGGSNGREWTCYYGYDGNAGRDMMGTKFTMFMIPKNKTAGDKKALIYPEFSSNLLNTQRDNI